jgi:hypothetical protein
MHHEKVTVHACHIGYGNIDLLLCICSQNMRSTIVKVRLLNFNNSLWNLKKFCYFLYQIYRNDTNGKSLFFSYWNCIWNIIVTMTTVGYGDYFA